MASLTDCNCTGYYNNYEKEKEVDWLVNVEGK